MTIKSSFLDIKDSNATGTTFKAPLRNGNVNSGNNLGWNFSNKFPEFSMFFLSPYLLTNTPRSLLPFIYYTDIQDCAVTGKTFGAFTSNGCVDSGNNTGISFS